MKPTDIQISELNASNQAQWDQYVRSAPHGLPQHLSGWRDVLQDTYGYRTHFLMATAPASAGTETGAETGDETRDAMGDVAGTVQDERSVVGVMPLFSVHSPLTGRRTSTLPGGLCAESHEVAQALIERGKAFTEADNADHLLLQDSRCDWQADLRSSTAHDAWLLDVEADEDAMRARIHRNIRRQIRMAERNNLVARVDRSGTLLDDFYHVLSHFTHQAGTPLFPRRFLQNVIQRFPQGYNIVIVYLDEVPIAGYFQLEMGQTMYGVWGAALHEHLSLRPVYLAYWTILTECMARGFVQLDMGRSPKEAGSAKFKAQWGSVAVPVYQQVASMSNHTSQTAPIERTESQAFQLFARCWPRVPYPIARYLGGKLRWHIPFA